MADDEAKASPTKLLAEKRENEGLSPYFGIPTVGKVHSLTTCSELLQYLCLMYRELHPKGRFCWREEKIAPEL